MKQKLIPIGVTALVLGCTFAYAVNALSVKMKTDSAPRAEQSPRINDAATLDPAYANLAKNAVPRAAGLRAAGEETGTPSGNKTIVTTNLLEQTQAVICIGAGDVTQIDPASFDMTFSADYSSYIIAGANANLSDYDLFGISGATYNATGTLASTEEISIIPVLCYLSGSWYIANRDYAPIMLNADNNFSATFDITTTNFPAGTPVGVGFLIDGSLESSKQATVSGLAFTSAKEYTTATPWSVEGNLPGLGINTDNPDVANCYTMMLDDAVTTIGIYLDGDQPVITGINTPETSVTLPDNVYINGTAYTFRQFGMEDSAFDWSGAQNLTELNLGKSVFDVRGDLSGSPITDLYMHGYTASFQYSSPEIYLHVPNGHPRDNYPDGMFKRVLVGDELPSYPETTVSEYVVAGEVEGEYFGITNIDGHLTITEIFSDNEAVTLPAHVPYNSQFYYSNGLGNDSNGYYGTLCANAPNLTTVTVPENCGRFDVDWPNSPITTLHLSNTQLPSTNYPLPSSITIHVGNQALYTAMEQDNNWNQANLVPEGWEFEWLTVNVPRKGEFAQTYIEMTDADWALGTYVKVTGTLNDSDLKNIKNLTSLRKLDLSEAVFDYLPDNFLLHCSTVDEVILPETLSVISSQAFYNCDKLTTVTAPGVSIIRGYAFYQCPALTNLDISNLTYIDEYAFAYCHAFAPATFNSELAYIGSYAFRSTAISEVNIPESITKIYSGTFAYCENLSTVKLPASVTSIGSEAFTGCPLLTSINLEEGLTQIEGGAFSGCSSLSELTLPSTLNSIGSYAFDYCSALLAIKCKAVVPPAASSSFTSGLDMNHCNLFVAPFSIDAYRAANGWKDFYIMKPLDEPVKNIYISRPMAFNLMSEDNAVLQENPNMTLDYTGSSADKVGQLYAEGDGTLSAGNFTIRHKFSRRNNAYGDQRTTLINNAENMRADNVECSVDFEKDYWHFISFQYDVQMADVYGLNNTDFVIREYNSERRAAATGEASGTESNWDNVPADGVLLAGKGYIISAANNSTNENGNTHSAVVRFPSRNTTTKNNLFTSNNIIVPLEEHISEFAHNRSWNLVGNPYPCYYDMHYLQEDFTTPIVLWRGASYQAYSPVDDDIVLRPNEAFFVQRPLDAEQMVFGVEGRLDYTQAKELGTTPGIKAPAMTAAASGRAVFNFNFSGCGSDDRTRIVMNENASLAYEAKYDAVKFFADNATGIEAYVNSNVQYDICERPLAGGSAELAARFATGGEYTLSLAGRNTEGWTVMLTDRLTGETVCLTDRDYTFRADAGTCEGRFMVVFASPAQTSIDELSAVDGNAAVRVFNTAGINVFSGRMADFRATATPGVYVVEAAGKSCKVVVK